MWLPAGTPSSTSCGWGTRLRTLNPRPRTPVALCYERGSFQDSGRMEYGLFLVGTLTLLPNQQEPRAGSRFKVLSVPRANRF